MEELLKQAREFEQSFWGGLFYFLIGVVFVASYCFFWPIQNWKSWLAISAILLAMGWAIYLFLEGHLLFASLLVLITLAGVARTVAIEIQRRRRRA
jgi:hypothetical protein